MDSSISNSFDMSFPKIEIDADNEISSYKRDSRYNWNSENTMKLIDSMEKECKELWDVKHPLNKDRVARQAKMEYLAGVFGTSAEEISRKIHNLRTQFNNELRKIKRRTGGEGGVVVAGCSGWEYFDALSFLLRAPPDPLDAVDAVNLALAEFQADEEVEFGIVARAILKSKNANGADNTNNITDNANNNASNNTNKNAGSITKNKSPPRFDKHRMRVAASAPPPLPPPVFLPEELPTLRPGINADECQIFGDFVASELRTLRGEESRKKLKRMIQKAILQVGEEEDVNIISG